MPSHLSSWPTNPEKRYSLLRVKDDTFVQCTSYTKFDKVGKAGHFDTPLPQVFVE